VFGSGFGLYGHLPALVELGKKVCIPLRYKPAFDDRIELEIYRHAVSFVDKENLSGMDLAVLARRPADNDALARQAILSRCRQLVVEKPPARTPQAASLLFSALRAAGVRHATPYLFAYCDWARDCKRGVEARLPSDITFDWHFNSSRAPGNWKAVQEEGGGLVSFYFIHVLALAEYLLGDFRITDCRSTYENSRSGLSMTASGGPNTLRGIFWAGVGASNFELSVNGLAVFAAETPFGSMPRRGTRDPRVDLLKRFYATEVFADIPAHHADERCDRILKAWASLVDRLQQVNADTKTAAGTGKTKYLGT